MAHRLKIMGVEVLFPTYVKAESQPGPSMPHSGLHVAAAAFQQGAGEEGAPEVMPFSVLQFTPGNAGLPQVPQGAILTEVNILCSRFG